MGEGKIRCCGTSLFLKSKFGTGFKINFIKERDIGYEDIINFVKQRIPNANLVEYSDVNIVIEIPRENIDKLSQLFRDLEQNKDKLKFNNYGFGSSNLEDVFLKVSEVNDHHLKSNNINHISFDDDDNKDLSYSFITHFNALFLKRMR